jgi:CRISPR-associated protein Csb2
MLPLPDVGHPHASGSILGVAVMLPRLLSPSERRVVLAAIGRWLEASGALTLPGGRRIRVRHVPDPILHTLRRVTWARPSVSWVSATPIALPWRARRAKNQADEWELAQEWVMAACGHVGLPAPEQVQVGLAPLLHGALPAGRYPAFRQGPTARRLVHARVRFAEPVEGPLVLGSGRFQGLGLMRPLPTGGSR